MRPNGKERLGFEESPVSRAIPMLVKARSIKEIQEVLMDVYPMMSEQCCLEVQLRLGQMARLLTGTIQHTSWYRHLGKLCLILLAEHDRCMQGYWNEIRQEYWAELRSVQERKWAKRIQEQESEQPEAN